MKLVHFLTTEQEKTLRVEYVNYDGFEYKDYNGYRNYAINTIPGVIEAFYKGGDDPNWMEALLFDSEEHLAWFLLRWS